MLRCVKRGTALISRYRRHFSVEYVEEFEDDIEETNPHGLVLSEFTSKKDFPIEGLDPSTIYSSLTLNDPLPYKKLQKSSEFTLTRSDYLTQLQKFTKG